MRFTELPIIMGRIDWLKGDVLFFVLISVIIAIGLGRGHVITSGGGRSRKPLTEVEINYRSHLFYPHRLQYLGPCHHSCHPLPHLFWQQNRSHHCHFH